MHSNELTFNELSASDFIDLEWGHIDISGYANYTDDEEVCFKLAVWSLQCKFGKLVNDYFRHLRYGIQSNCTLDSLVDYKRGLEVLNSYDPRDITGDTTDHNVIEYSTILKVLQKLHKGYENK
jgi:hypothetical protein